MSDEKISLEVTSVVRMESGDVKMSPRRGRAVFAVAFGLLIAVGALWAIIFAFVLEAVLFLFIAGGLAYIGVRALRAPAISIDINQRKIQSHSSGAQSPQTWSFDALELVEGIPSDEEQSPINLHGISLQFKDGDSLRLFTTADVKKATKVGQWLYAAFVPKPAE